MSQIITRKRIGPDGFPLHTLTFDGDLSASRVTNPIRLGVAKVVGVTFKVPVTIGAARPVGVFGVQENMTGDDADWETIPESLAEEWLAKQPTGNGSKVLITLRDIRTSAPLLRGIYTASSGGVGAAAEVFVFGK